FTVICMSGSLVIALLSWNLYEKHFLKLKRFFPRREGDITNVSRAPKAPQFGSAATLGGATSERQKVL
ncbi:MAG: hypothetical protein ABR582_17435, partial [Gemmatimonadaceae bacterium]